ncbi:MAG: glycosyltransferase family 4 protein [Candidatus Omnitrophica bacterium]|nr:glycosyltransferase family 4 protein [Candidatus Omnitrophota bacterium]
MNKKKVFIIANCGWAIQNFRTLLIKELIRKGYVVHVICPRDEYIEELVSIGIVYYDWKLLRSGINPFSEFFSLIKLFLICLKNRPDILMGFTIKPNIYGAIVAKLLKIPFMATITGLGTVFIEKSFFTVLVKSLYRHSLRGIYKVFFENKHDQKFFIEEKIVTKQNSITVGGAGVDTQKYAPMLDQKEKDIFVFLLVARMLKDKGVIEFVEAARILHNKYSDMSFELLGPCDDINKTAISSKEIKEWEKEGFIKYTGLVYETKPYYAKADCVVLPSYREGLSGVLLEASSMAIPTITTDVPGCQDVVRHGVNGFLCKARDVGSLVSAMEKIYKTPQDQRNVMGENGRRIAQQEFDVQKVTAEFCNVVDLAFK